MRGPRESAPLGAMPTPATPLPAALQRLALSQAGLVSAAQCSDTDLAPSPLRRLVRAGTLLPVVRGVYLVTDSVVVPPSRGAAHDLRRRRAAITGLLAHGEQAVATGLAALVLLGVQGAPSDMSADVALRDGHSRRPIPGVRLRQVRVRKWLSVGDFACVPAEVALAQAVPEVDRLTAVCLMDSAMNRGLISPADLEHAHDLARGHRGVARTHEWWRHADHRAESPAETFAWLTCADAGYPPDVLQLRVTDARGRFLARTELAWRLPDGRWLLVEVDGVDYHGSAEHRIADLHRQNPLITAATLLRRYSGADAMSGRLAADVVPILRAAGWRSGAVIPGGPLRLPDETSVGGTATGPLTRLPDQISATRTPAARSVLSPPVDHVVLVASRT